MWSFGNICLVNLVFINIVNVGNEVGLKNVCIVKDVFFDNIFSKYIERSLLILEMCYDWV